MSLILEALRKSEAERRLGSAPDVLAPMPVMHAPAPQRRRPVAIAGVALSILALTVAGWWLSGRSNTSVATHATPSAPPAAIVSPQHITAPATSAVAPPAIAASPPAAPVPATIPAATAPVRDFAASPTPPPPVATPAKTRDASNSAIASAAKDAVSRSTLATSPPAPAVTPVAAPPLPAADEPTLLPVPDLPTSERNALPALKVTMHVYAEDPAQRFMIVDGLRVGEGGRLGDGIVLVRIRRDGAEIDAHGRRLLLPNP